MQEEGLTALLAILKNASFKAFEPSKALSHRISKPSYDRRVFFSEKGYVHPKTGERAQDF